MRFPCFSFFPSSSVLSVASVSTKQGRRGPLSLLCLALFCCACGPDGNGADGGVVDGAIYDGPDGATDAPIDSAADGGAFGPEDDLVGTRTTFEVGVRLTGCLGAMVVRSDGSRDPLPASALVWSVEDTRVLSPVDLPNESNGESEDVQCFLGRQAGTTSIRGTYETQSFLVSATVIDSTLTLTFGESELMHGILAIAGRRTLGAAPARSIQTSPRAAGDLSHVAYEITPAIAAVEGADLVAQEVGTASLTATHAPPGLAPQPFAGVVQIEVTESPIDRIGLLTVIPDSYGVYWRGIRDPHVGDCVDLHVETGHANYVRTLAQEPVRWDSDARRADPASPLALTRYCFDEAGSFYVEATMGEWRDRVTLEVVDVDRPVMLQGATETINLRYRINSGSPADYDYGARHCIDPTLTFTNSAGEERSVASDPALSVRLNPDDDMIGTNFLEPRDGCGLFRLDPEPEVGTVLSGDIVYGYGSAHLAVPFTMTVIESER